MTSQTLQNQYDILRQAWREKALDNDWFNNWLVKNYNNNQEVKPGVLNTTLRDLDATGRLYNALNRAGVVTVGDLLKKTVPKDLWRIRGLGKRSQDELFELLLDVNITATEDRWMFNNKIAVTQEQ